MIGCSYRNTSDRMVILKCCKCCGAHQYFLERVVFPFELLSFQAPEESLTEVWTHGIAGGRVCELALCWGPQQRTGGGGWDPGSGPGRKGTGVRHDGIVSHRAPRLHSTA